MDREDTAHGRGGGLLVYTREGILGAKIDKQVKFRQCSCFQVYDTTIYSVYRSPNTPHEAVKEIVEIVRKKKMWRKIQY
jgi:hypothetical protein